MPIACAVVPRSFEGGVEIAWNAAGHKILFALALNTLKGRAGGGRRWL